MNMICGNKMFFNEIGCLSKGEKMCKMIQDMGSQKHKGQVQM
jgi:hypothetical protein